jgi:hypothetical protein
MFRSYCFSAAFPNWRPSASSGPVIFRLAIVGESLGLGLEDYPCQAKKRSETSFALAQPPRASIV